MNLNESFLSTEGNLMTSVSPGKLRPRWRIWVTAVNCGFLIPNHLSLENLAGGKKKINQCNLDNSKTIYSSTLASSLLALTTANHLFFPGKRQLAGSCACMLFPLFTGKLCFMSFCAIQYRLTWKQNLSYILQFIQAKYHLLSC